MKGTQLALKFDAPPQPAHVSQPFAHREYLDQLGALRDQLKAGLTPSINL